jgi:hypothetical protein
VVTPASSQQPPSDSPSLHWVGLLLRLARSPATLGRPSL